MLAQYENGPKHEVIHTLGEIGLCEADGDVDSTDVTETELGVGVTVEIGY